MKGNKREMFKVQVLYKQSWKDLPPFFSTIEEASTYASTILVNLWNTGGKARYNCAVRVYKLNTGGINQ